LGKKVKERDSPKFCSVYACLPDNVLWMVYYFDAFSDDAVAVFMAVCYDVCLVKFNTDVFRNSSGHAIFTKKNIQ
jgi:hypothetical protein